MQDRPDSYKEEKERYFFEKKFHQGGYIGRNYDPLYHEKKKEPYESSSSYHHRKNYQ